LRRLWKRARRRAARQFPLQSRSKECGWLWATVVPACLCFAACVGRPEDPPADRDSLRDKAVTAEALHVFLIERDWKRWPEFYSPNATVNGSDLALRIMRGTADGLNYSFAELELSIEQQIAEPAHVATSFFLEGRHEQPFNDLPATHARLRIDGFAFDRIEDGKIVESRLFLDVWGLSQRASAAARQR
jgi:predicted ester cyclase